MSAFKYIRRALGGKDVSVNFSVKDPFHPTKDELGNLLGAPEKIDYFGSQIWVNEAPEQVRAIFWTIRSEAVKVNNKFKKEKPALTLEERYKEVRTQMVPFIADLFDKISRQGVKEVIGSDYDELIKKMGDSSDRLSVVDKAMKPPLSPAKKEASSESDDFEESVSSFGPTPLKVNIPPSGTAVSNSTRITTMDELRVATLSDLVVEFENGLEYDKFDTARFRASFFLGKDVISLNELTVLIMSYLFCGNNQNRLSDKVKEKAVGSLALQVCNRFGVVKKKVNAQSVTLARIAIAFSPMTYVLREVLYGDGKLPFSGVITTTPRVIQDVALSGISDRIPRGAEIVDFLKKFNRALTKFAEKDLKKDGKSSEEQMDEVALKFYEIARSGASSDELLMGWQFKRSDLNELSRFYDSAMNASVNSSY